MHIKLNFWQTLGLFLPVVIGFIIIDIPNTGVADYNLNLLGIANLLFVINLLIVILYQTILAVRFNYISGVKSNLFKWNALIPAIFISTYFFYVFYLTANSPTYHNPRYNHGPMKIAQYGTVSWLILLFLLHSFITFYFINNEFVSRQIKVIKNDSEQDQLRSDFLIPMRRLVKISIWVIGTLLLISTVVDVVIFSKFAN